MQKTKKLLTIGITAIVLVAMLTVMPAPASAATLNVPADYGTIQAAIDAASVFGGDTVLVAPGTYTESITMKPLVTIQGSGADVTTIHGNDIGRTITGADNSTISGFTITGGTSGIYNQSSSPVITNNIITGNSWEGIYNQSSSPVITNNIITGNSLYGINNNASSPWITNNTITGNSFGIWDDFFSSSTITNNIITGNGYGIYSLSFSSPTIDYNDVWDNAGGNVGYYAGLNNISVNPKFVDPGSWDGNGNWVQGDYHLQYDSSVLVSPIDAGDNTAPGLTETDFDGNSRIVDGNDDGIDTVDMGAFEYIVNESLGADADGDGVSDDNDACRDTPQEVIDAELIDVNGCVDCMLLDAYVHAQIDPVGEGTYPNHGAYVSAASDIVKPLKLGVDGDQGTEDDQISAECASSIMHPIARSVVGKPETAGGRGQGKGKGNK